MKNRMATHVDPDETARHEPSYQDLHCLHRYLFWSAGLKRLSGQRRPDQTARMGRLVWGFVSGISDKVPFFFAAYLIISNISNISFVILIL